MNYIKNVYLPKSHFLLYLNNLYSISSCSRNFSYKKTDNYSEYFKTLNISEDSDQLTAREAFLKLAKKFHPDSGNKQADSAHFLKVETAYRKLLEKFSHDRRNNDCEGEFGLYYEQKKKQEGSEEHADEKIQDIKHTSPQHRQYLSYEGIGFGTPSQREKQFFKFRAMKAAENVIDYKVQQLNQDPDETSLATKDKSAARKIRTRYGIDRLVEDKIQESMAKGDFDNLPNAGKPLKFQNHNPFVDNVTHKLNQVLIESGYAPEWVMLEREIRDHKLRITRKMETFRSKLGLSPLAEKEELIWLKFVSSLTPEVSDLNQKIDKYNLVVPIMTKQSVHFPLKKIEEKILKAGKTKREKSVPTPESEEDKSSNTLSSTAIEKEFGFKAIIDIFKGR